MADVKPSVTELAQAARKVLVMGNGGGGDVVQAIPIANHLKLLGVEEVIFGGINCAWIDEESGAPQEETPSGSDPATFVLGPTIYDLDLLTPSTRIAPHIVEVTAETRLHGHLTGEATVSGLFGDRAIVIGLGDGVPAAAADLQAFLDREGIGLVISTDVGSDSMFTGEEACPAHTPLADFMSIGLLTRLRTPSVFSLGGWGCDGELLHHEIERSVSKAMANGGFLGAHGMTQRDVVDMEAACDRYADPVQVYVARAARGQFGHFRIRTLGPWGQPIHVTTLAATMLFFDPRTLAEHVCTIVPEIAAAESLAAAEEAYERRFGVPPETRLIKVARLRAP